MKPRRSIIIAPANNRKFIQNLSVGEQDVAILDLEDGVYETEKESARQQCVDYLRHFSWGNRERVVRINPMDNPHSVRDIEVVVAGQPDAIMLAKAQSADDVKLASSLIEQAERKAGLPVGSVKMWSMIETANALLRVEDICRADSRMTAVQFGGGDLCVDLRVKRIGLGAFRRTGWPAIEYIYGRSKLVLAARAAGVDPIDVCHLTYADLEGTRRVAEYSAQMGFAGALVVSPRQIPVVNEVFTPPAEDISWATEVVSKFEAANRNEARTIVVVDGDMIDGPFVLNARQILERAELYRKTDADRKSTNQKAAG